MSERERQVIERAEKEIAAIRAEELHAAIRAEVQAAENLAGCAGKNGELRNEYREPKPWVEASIEQKLERTRDMVKSLQTTARYLDGRISEMRSLRDDLIEHRHAIDDGGKVMLPADGGRKRLNDQGGCCEAAQEVAPERAYF